MKAQGVEIYYVSSEGNIADSATRGFTIQKLIKNHRW